MLHKSDIQGEPVSRDANRILSLLIWLSLSTCLAVSLFTVVEELCLATACRDTAAFTFFGIGMGWLGIAYFTLILVLFWRRKINPLLGWAVAALVFSGVGAEVRLLWIQKVIIGSWCPLCVTICCALCSAAALLLIEEVQGVRRDPAARDRFIRWMFFVVVMILTGLGCAVVGVKELS